MAEEFALEERFDDRGAIDRHERFDAARTAFVERSRHEFLAAAGFAGDEGRSDVRTEAANQAEQLLHRGAAANHSAEFGVLRDFAVRRQQLAAPFEFVVDCPHQPLEATDVERFGEVVDRAELHRFHRAVDGGVAAHQHDLAVGIGRANRRGALRSADLRHPQVDDRHVDVSLLEAIDRLTAARTRDEIEPGAGGEVTDDWRIDASSSTMSRVGRRESAMPWPAFSGSPVINPACTFTRRLSARQRARCSVRARQRVQLCVGYRWNDSVREAADKRIR